MTTTTRLTQILRDQTTCTIEERHQAADKLEELSDELQAMDDWIERIRKSLHALNAVVGIKVLSGNAVDNIVTVNNGDK